MHVALLANSAWLDEELSMYRHLVIGLLDEQIGVVQVLPGEIKEEDAVAFAARVDWEDSRWSLLRSRRLTTLADGLRERGVNVIHAMDRSVWRGALQLAEALGAAAVFQAASGADVDASGRFGKQMDLSRMAMAATTAPIAEGVRQALGPQAMVEFVPASAPAGDDKQREQHQSQIETDTGAGALCLVISGNARCDADHLAMFEGVRLVLADYPMVQCFIDQTGESQHEMWAAADRFGLLSNVSFVPRRLGHHELILRADVFVQPQALGHSRGLTLQAMASGMPVVARDDPWLDYLIDDETAWIIDEADADRWHERLRRIIEHPADAKQLGRRAQAWIRQNRRVSTQIDQYRMLYHRVSGEGIKLPGV